MKKRIKIIWKNNENWLSWLLLVVIAGAIAIGMIYSIDSELLKRQSAQQAAVTDTLEEAAVSIEEIMDTFPLTKGSYWMYQASVKWTKVGGEIIEKDLTWKMEVVDTAVYKNIIAVHLRGFPWELDWHYEDLERGDYSMIIVDLKKFYLLDDTGVFEQIKNKENLTYDLSEDNLWFDFPLSFGKTWGYIGAETRPRDDHYYSWYVKNESPADLGNIKGVPPPRSDLETEYEIEFYTLPGHRIINFVPGLGITGYTYVHHGTISEAYLKLVEYYIAE